MSDSFKPNCGILWFWFLFTDSSLHVHDHVYGLSRLTLLDLTGRNCPWKLHSLPCQIAWAQGSGTSVKAATSCQIWHKTHLQTLHTFMFFNLLSQIWSDRCYVQQNQSLLDVSTNMVPNMVPSVQVGFHDPVCSIVLPVHCPQMRNLGGRRHGTFDSTPWLLY